MAVFQFNNISLPYRVDFSPLDFDLVLLQNSSFSAPFWNPVIEDLGFGGARSGRILTCDWVESGAPNDRPKNFSRLIQTLGLQQIHVVGMNDAVVLIDEMERLHPGLFEEKLLYAHSSPKGAELVTAVRAFCGL